MPETIKTDAVVYHAQALGHEACRQGLQVLYINTHKMLKHLHGGRADDSLESCLNTYLRTDLLILDDFGLKPLQPIGVKLTFP